MQTRNLAVLLLLGAVWGASFLFIKIGVAELAPAVLVTLRLSIAAVALLALLAIRGGRLPTSWRTWANFCFTGFIGLVMPYLLITWGEQSIPSGMAAILNATTPLFTVLLSYVWTREEQLTGARLLGVALGFVGVVVAVGVSELSLASASTQGQLAVLLAAACYGFNGLYSRRAFRGQAPLLTATGQLLAAALMLAPVALALDGLPAGMPSARAIAAVLALSLLGTALAYVLLYWLIERVGATLTSMVTYLLPPFALIYGALFLREAITISALLGLVLVVLGIMLANRLLRWPARQPLPLRDKA